MSIKYTTILTSSNYRKHITTPFPYTDPLSFYVTNEDQKGEKSTSIFNKETT